MPGSACLSCRKVYQEGYRFCQITPTAIDFAKQPPLGKTPADNAVSIG